MNIEYRIAEESDIEALIKLRFSLNDYICNREGLILENEDLLRENIRKTLQKELNKTIYFYLAILDDEVVAGGGIIIHQMIPGVHLLNGIKGYITGVYTDENYRKKGLQKQIIGMLLDLAKQKGCQKVELDAVNPHAIELYKSFGFQKMGEKFSINIK